MDSMSGKIIVTKGGPGSGNHGHAGRPGKRGGSAPGGSVFNPGKGMPMTRDYVTDVALSGVLWGDGSQSPRIIKDTIVTTISADTGIEYDVVNDIVAQWAISSNDNDMRSISLQEAAAEEFGLELSEWQQEKLRGANMELEDIERQAKKEEDITYNILLRNKINGVASVKNLSDEELRKVAHDVGYNKYIENAKADAPRYFPITSRENERAVLRAIYSRTQAALAQQGLKPDDYVTIYRGIIGNSIKLGDDGDVVNYKGNVMESWSRNSSVAFGFARATPINYGYMLGIRVPVRNVISSARTGFGCMHESEFVIFGNVPGTTVTILEHTDPHSD